MLSTAHCAVNTQSCRPASYAWFPSLRNDSANHRTGLRRQAAGTCGQRTCNSARIALPQALALSSFFSTFLSNGKMLTVRCVKRALHCVTDDGNHAFVVTIHKKNDKTFPRLNSTERTLMSALVQSMVLRTGSSKPSMSRLK